MNDAPPMSDAPPMTSEDAVEDRYIKDRFMNGGIFKAKKSAIKEQKNAFVEADGKQNVAPNRTRADGDKRTFVHRTLQGRHVKRGRGESAFRFE